MKLLFCPSCSDIVRLKKMPKTCDCGKVGGRYLDDGLQIEYFGEAVPIFIDSSSFVEAIQRRAKNGLSSFFTAGIIPQDCDTVTHHE